MATKKTNVILTSYTQSNEKQTRIKLDAMTEKQKQDFLDTIRAYDAPEGLVSDKCAFNVHYDSAIIHWSPIKLPRDFVPQHSQNQKNEIIVEMIPALDDCGCYAVGNKACLTCLRSGGCTAPGVRDVIGKILFPDKYAKQK